MTTSQAVDEAATWLVRLCRADASTADHAQFAAWLSDNPENKPAYDEVFDIWEAVREPLSLLDPHDLMADDMSPDTASNTAEYAEPNRRRTRAWLPLALAASIVIATALGVTTYVMPTHRGHQTSIGMIEATRFEDGSIATLNTSSRLTVSFTEDRRNVSLLEGEAFFDVAADPDRPFVVDTPQGRAIAIGTAFGVRIAKDATEVSVVEGLVEVRSDEDSVRIGQDERASIVASSINQSVVDALAHNAWKDGLLIYDGVRLQSLIDDLNRYFPQQMTVADANLRDVRVSATLRIDDQRSVLAALSETLSLRWAEVSNDLIIISRAPALGR